MITMVVFIVMINMYLFAYLAGMVCGWELIFPFVMAVPIYAYERSQNKVWLALFTTQCVGILSRIALTSYVGLTQSGVTLPLTMDQTLVRQFCGMSNIIAWLLWYIIAGLFMIVTAKNSLVMAKTIKAIDRNRHIIHATNLFSVTTVIVIIQLTVSIQAYALNEQYANMIVFIGIILVTSVACYIMQTQLIRDRKTEILNIELANSEQLNETIDDTDESVDEDLEFIDLEKTTSTDEDVKE